MMQTIYCIFDGVDKDFKLLGITHRAFSIKCDYLAVVLTHLILISTGYQWYHYRMQVHN